MFTAVKQKKKKEFLKDFSVLDTVISFFVSGVIFGAIYDFFRFFRLLFKNKIVCFILDFIYMIIISLLFFIDLLGFNNGMVRYYFIVLSVLGFLFYIFTVFRLTEKIEKPVSLIIRKSLKKVLHFIKKVYYNLFSKHKQNKKTEKAKKIKISKKNKKIKNIKKKGRADESIVAEIKAE